MSSSRLKIALLVAALLSAQTARADFSWTVDQYFTDESAQPAMSIANPENDIIRSPSQILEDDIRPEFKWITPNTKWIFRPRFILQQESAEVAGQNQTEGFGTSDITDAYVDIAITDSFHTTTGLEVYQWGPAELFNASNPLYHLNTESRSAFYKEKGQALARFTWDTLETWTNMLILNPVSNNATPWRADQEFHGSGLLKSELRTQAGDSYLGFLAGNQPDGRNFFGEYANLASDFGFSLYFDSRHPIGHRSYRPILNSLGDEQMVDVTDETGVQTIGLAGLRYEGRVDVRFEYLYNSEGFSSDEFTNALQSMTQVSPWLITNYAYFLKPGLELPGREYGYFSLRVPDVGWKKEASAFLRILLSFQDQSNVWQAAFDEPLSDSLVLDLEANVFSGADNKELTLLDRSLVLAGLKWTL